MVYSRICSWQANTVQLHLYFFLEFNAYFVYLFLSCLHAFEGMLAGILLLAPVLDHHLH